MLDWNGDGKIDPTDIGISMAAFEESVEPGKVKRNKPGCLMSMLTFLFAIILFSLILCLS